VLPSAHPGAQPKRQIDRFSRFAQLTADTLQWAPLSPKIAPFHGGSGPPSSTWFLGPTRVLNQNDISISSAVFAGLTSVTHRQTDRQTDRPRFSVGNNRPHLCVRSTAMRPNNNNNLYILNAVRCPPVTVGVASSIANDVIMRMTS